MHARHAPARLRAAPCLCQSIACACNGRRLQPQQSPCSPKGDAHESPLAPSCDRWLAAPYAQSRPLSIETIDLAPPGAGEVLVKIAAPASAIPTCPASMATGPRPLPVALGHEASAVVQEVGPDVMILPPRPCGDVSFVPTCGHCAMCADAARCPLRTGQCRQCRRHADHRQPPHHLHDASINHHCGVCAFSDMRSSARRSIVKIRKDIALTHAALFGCAVLTGFGAVMTPVRSARPVGRGHRAGRRWPCCTHRRDRKRGRQIVAIDLNPAKLDVARQLGATDVFLASSTGRGGPGARRHARRCRSCAGNGRCREGVRTRLRPSPAVAAPPRQRACRRRQPSFPSLPCSLWARSASCSRQASYGIVRPVGVIFRDTSTCSWRENCR